MTIEAFRLQNFMCFEDSGWLELRQLTLLYGRHSAGKSAIFRALLLLRQSLASKPSQEPLIFAHDDGFDFGSYAALVRDHDTSRLISFWFKCEFDEGGPVGSAPPGLALAGSNLQVKLSYRLANSKVGLHSLALYDEQEQLIWQALKQSEGWSFEADFLRQDSTDVWRETVLTVEEGFFPKLRLLTASPQGQLFPKLVALLCHLERSIFEFFSTLHYVGPMRPAPQRFYHLPAEVNGANGANGALRALLTPESSLISSVNEWLATSGLKARLELKPLRDSPEMYELLFSNPWSRRVPPFQANMTEVGFGVSQALPVVLETLLAPPASTLLLEHPGQHLHPNVHLQLGDLFIRAGVRNKVRLLIESHSETLMIRMRRRVAESSLGYLSASENGYLPYEAIRLYFVDRESGQNWAEDMLCSEVQMLHLNEKGGIFLSPEGFRGFFADDLRETMALTKARLGR